MKLGQHRLVRQMSAGPDGIRYLAEDGISGTKSDIRVLNAARQDPARWSRLTKRIKTAQLLDAGSSQKIIEPRFDHDPPYVALEWPDGPTLLDALGASPPSPPAEVIAFAQEMARTLEKAHKLGLVHGHLSPAAIRMRGNSPVADWTGIDCGVARPSPAAAALDAACRPKDPVREDGPLPAFDLFSLGAILAWRLTGQVVRGRPDVASLGSDPGLARLVRELLDLDPISRPSARETQSRLAELVRRVETTGEFNPSVSQTSVTQILGTPSADNDERTIEVPYLNLDITRERLGRYRIVDKLGQGGMGAVYKADDLSDGTTVAIKVLNVNFAKKPESLRRFLKEARLLAEVNSPHVANFIDVNEDDGTHYLVLEYVEGSNLAELISESGKLDEAVALEIVADVARALTLAHERGIIHRDIKPENVLLKAGPDGKVGQPYQVKLSDFGLARHVVESESLVLTQAGVILGTPLYMAPEQCMGDENLTAGVDVYALGATLFHLLSGRTPFLGTTALGLIASHRNEPPPRLRDLDPAITEATAQIVAKALEKKPEARYRDAAELLDDIERRLHGRPTAIDVHPRLPQCDPADIQTFEWRWELEASPRQLWPHVSNTERLNKAAGMTAVSYRREDNPAGGVNRLGHFKKAGVSVTWREHPFEWIEGRRLGVLREYTEGPFRWFLSSVELTPKSDGGTVLVHRVQVEPTGLLGRTLAAVEIGVRGHRSVDKVYRRIDAALTGKLGADATVDPFEAPEPLSGDRRKKLDRWLDDLGQKGMDPTVIERLGDYIASAPSQELARIRPLTLARRLNVDPDALVDACLHGARAGTLILLWDLLCPVCRIPSEVVDTLKNLRDHGRCDTCRVDYDLDFANSVEMIFRAHPEIRETDLATYCIGGPAHSQHVAAQTRIAAGEHASLDLALGLGNYRFRSPQLGFAVDFRVEASAPSHRWDLDLLKGPAPNLPRVLRAGNQSLRLSNPTDREIVIRVERIAAREDALTAARASTSARFREYFPGEILTAGRLVNLATITLLVTRPAVDRDLFGELGESDAFGLLHEHFLTIESIVRRAGGALVKTVEEGTVSAFHDPAAAVEAALGVVGALEQSERSRRLGISAGVHRGPAMVATLNDHLDYFGSMVRVASQLPGLGRGGDVLITPEVAGTPGVAALLSGRGLAAEVLDRPLGGAAVSRLAPSPAAAGTDEETNG